MENFENRNNKMENRNPTIEEMLTVQILPSLDDLKKQQEYNTKSNIYPKDDKNSNEKPIISLFETKHKKNYSTKEMEIDIHYVNTEAINLDIEHKSNQKNLKLENLIFLFINPRSGSEEGKLIFEIIKKNNSVKNNNGENLYKFLFDEKEGEKKFAYIFNIIDKDHYKMGCQLLNSFISESQDDEKLRVLIGGGDGTVLSIIEDLNKRNININKCYFGHLPLGTGNDLSNALGFGGQVEINSDPKSLKKIFNRYYTANLGKIDVWILKLTVDKEKGEIIEFSKKTKTRKLIENNVYKRSFINYFSIGYDARVGFGFERKRSGNRCWNKFLYFWEGLKKNCCRRTLSLNNFLDAFMVAEQRQKPLEIKSSEENGDKNFFAFNSTVNGKLSIEDSIINGDHKIKTVFKPQQAINKNKSPKEEKQNYKEIIVKGDPVNIICQNINFYMGGTKDIWRKSGKSIGLKVVEGDNRKISKIDTNYIENKLSNSEQRLNDQKLEFFTYSSGFKLGFEKLFTGRADKVYHGPGPILIKFKDTPERTEKDKYGRVYLNIDGEYFHIIKPLELRMKLNNDLCGGSLNFIMNK